LFEIDDGGLQTRPELPLRRQTRRQDPAITCLTMGTNDARAVASQ
jgi:hypothetical protein